MSTDSRRFSTCLSFVLLVSILVGAVAANESQNFSVQQVEFFEKKIRPVLVKRCYECHSHEFEEGSGGLFVDSRSGLLAGGDLGPAVVVGRPNDSLLLTAVRYQDEALQMPPNGKLSEDEIQLLEEWIRIGVPDPRMSPVADSVADAVGEATLWSLEPIARPSIQTVRDKNWPSNDIDRFVLARLEAADLAPAKDAEPFVLLRRLHYTLTGLPPRPAELIAFSRRCNDGDRHTAVAETIDRLLSSQAFGQRWARHWLDMVRYADVHGGTRPEPMLEAWRYRNYVIDAMNADKPFDEFIGEQIAGDLLPYHSNEERAENLVATTFLTLGHFDLNERDADRVALDRIDEQLDSVGKTFLGLSLGCARCHDHKFDPVPTRDYYALAGIFRSTTTLTQLPKRAAKMVAMKLPEVGKTAPEWMRANKTTFKDKNVGNQLKSTPGPPHAYVAADADQINDEAIHVRGEINLLGDLVPRGFLTAVSLKETPEIPDASSGRLELVDWLVCDDNPLTSRVLVNRFWHHLFGAGIVHSVDNFGTMGGRPSHPELLDHLARRFQSNGWSLKSFIREVLQSRTWQMSNSFNSTANEVDPANRLLWRMNRRRFDAETVHDWLFSVSDRLDSASSTFTVPSFRISNNSNTQKTEIPPQTLDRRAIYWPVFRKDVPHDIDMLGIYNFPDPMLPTGARDSSTLPTQALFLLDSPLVLDCAGQLARRLTREFSDEQARVRQLYLVVLNRIATDTEVAAAIGFLNGFSDQLQEENAAKQPRNVAWNRLCHTLLISNASLTVE